MPLLKGAHNVRKNIEELVKTKPSKTRAKGIRTLARRRGISTKEAKVMQAIAIARSKAREK